MFAQEIERELRMLEEFVMTDEVSDDVGENLIPRDEDFDPPEVPFQPKPTSVSVAAIAAGDEFSSDSNFTTMPKVEKQEPPLDLAGVWQCCGRAWPTPAFGEAKSGRGPLSPDARPRRKSGRQFSPRWRPG